MDTLLYTHWMLLVIVSHVYTQQIHWCEVDTTPNDTSEHRVQYTFSSVTSVSSNSVECLMNIRC